MYRSIILLALLIPFSLSAQMTPLNSLFDESIEEPGFSSSEIRTKDVSFKWENEPDTEQVREVLDGLESIRILKYDQSAQEARKDVSSVYKKVERAIGKDNYQEAMTFSSDNDKVHIYFLKQGEDVKEFAMIAKGSETMTLITVTGDINLEKMMSKETIKGLWSLKSIYSDGNHMDIEVYDDDAEKR